LIFEPSEPSKYFKGNFFSNHVFKKVNMDLFCQLPLIVSKNIFMQADALWGKIIKMK